MAALHQKFEEWTISETNLLSDGREKLFPDSSAFRRLTEGKHAEIWKYVVNHVRSRANADKVKRILRLKREQGEPDNPYPVIDADQIRKRIAKAEEKRSFLNRSLSGFKREVESTESDVRCIKAEVCILNQKCAILELTISEYNKKCAFLHSIESELTSYVLRNSKQNTKFDLVLNFPLSHCVESTFGDDQISNRVKYVLKHVDSLIVDSKGAISGSAQNVNHMLNTISLEDLFILLKESSNASYMELMSNETYSSSVEVQPLNIEKKKSAKYFQGMKLRSIQSSFATKKAKKEILRLQEEKESLISNFMLKEGGTEFEKKCKMEMFKKVAENAGLVESIKFLEDALNKEDETKMLKVATHENTAKSGNLEAVAKNFYSNFDTLCTLLKSAPCRQDYIIKLLLKLHTYVNKQMFSNISQNFKEYPLQMEQNLTFDIQTLLPVLERNCVIKSLFPTPLPSFRLFGFSKQEIWMTLLDIPRFEKIEHAVVRKVKNTKDKLSTNQDSEFKFRDDGFLNIHRQYIAVMETLQKMQDKIELCGPNFRKSSEHIQRVKVVLNDWWEQGAQFIPQIEWDDKSLKMWQDILRLLPHF